MTIPKKTVLLVSILFMSIAVATPLYAEGLAETNSRFARVILFVPDGSEMPPAYEEKLRNIAIRTESFFTAEIEHWGWKVGRREIFARNPAGEIEIIVVRGTLPDNAIGRDALPVITRKAITEATKKLGEGSARHSVWWIFYHYPDHKVRGFRGMGGRSINAYPVAKGIVTPDIDLASKEMWPLNLKGCIHEFGHALGLPHIGPKPSQKRGNTLMGPVNKAFAARLSEKEEDSRVYLSEASAAMLVRHPLFASSPRVEGAGSYEIKVSHLSFEEAPGNVFKVKGTVTSKVKVDSVVILDSQRGFGDYWARSYCARVSDKGEFSVIVSDSFDGRRGKLTLFFCLEDGRNSATGKREVLQGDFIEIYYEGDAGERRFKRQPYNDRARPRKG